MITIKDIAKEAGVSEGTVDRVIHNRGGVSKKTEQRIQQLLKHHNFSVNPIARALALKNNYNVAALIPEHNDSDLFWKAPYLGILKCADDLKTFGINVKTFTYNQYNHNSYKKSFKNLIRTKPSAIIMVPNFTIETAEITSQLESLKIPYLFLNIDIEGFKNIAFIGQDSYRGGHIAAKLMQLSTPNPSHFLIIQAQHNITNNNAVSKRISGFNDYFLKNNNYKTQTLKIENLNNLPETRNIINKYLERHPEIKGIFVPSSRIYIVANCLKSVFLKNIELIGFDNTPQNIDCLINDSVSFLISQKPFDQGYDSIRIMSQFLLKNEKPNNKHYLPIEILIKENVAYN